MTCDCVCERTLKKNLDIHFTHSSNKEIYGISETCCVISLLFPTKCHLLQNCIFFCLNNTHVFHKPSTKILIPRT